MPTQSTQVLLMESLATMFGALSTGRTIQHVKMPWAVAATHPGIFLVPVPETIKDATNAQDDYLWGVAVYLTTASNRDVRSSGGTADLDAICYDRQRMMRLCHRKVVLSSPKLWGTVEPGAVIDPSAFALNFDLSAFTVRGQERYSR